jgi:hypothetical protein
MVRDRKRNIGRSVAEVESRSKLDHGGDYPEIIGMWRPPKEIVDDLLGRLTLGRRCPASNKARETRAGLLLTGSRQ